jgi:hypothetical protein
MSRSTRAVSVLAGLTLMGVAIFPVGPGAAAALDGPAPALSSIPQQLASDPGTDVAGPALSYTGRYVAYHAHRRDQGPGRQELRRTDLVSGTTELGEVRYMPFGVTRYTSGTTFDDHDKAFYFVLDVGGLSRAKQLLAHVEEVLAELEEVRG